MTSSADLPTVITGIVCVVRTSAPAVLALDHVVQVLDEFLDVSVLLSLPKAAASGCVRWFDRVYQRTIGTSTLATPPRIDEDPLIEYALSNAIKEAVKHSHMKIVQRIHALHPQRLPVRLLPIAAEAGDLAIFQWLLAHRTDDSCMSDCDSSARTTPSIELLGCCLSGAYSIAIEHEQLHIVKWLLENGYVPSDSDGKAGDAAALSGNLEMVQWLHTSSIPHSFSKRAIDNAVKNGHSQVVQYLLTNRSEGFTSKAVHNAVMGGYDDIHEMLRLSGILSAEKFASLGKWAHFAAEAGRLDLLKCGRYAISEDAIKTMSHSLQYAGRLEVVEWLWQHYKIRPDAPKAAYQGHVHLLQWMQREFGYVNCGVMAMNCAAENGHLAVVQWLHANQPERFSTIAMDYAAKNGHFEVVQWLHENRQEGCSASAMDYAAENGHLEIVQWLHCHRKEGCTVRAMDGAAANNHQQIVEWLHAHRRRLYDASADPRRSQWPFGDGDLAPRVWL